MHGLVSKKMLTATLASLSAVSLAFISPVVADAAAPVTGHQHSLVALGDSITFGYNLSDTDGNKYPSQLAYPNLVAQHLSDSLTNLAVPGWTSTDLLNALPTSAYERAVKDASVVTLDIGSNDLLQTSEELGLLSQAASKAPVQVTGVDTIAFTAAIELFSKNFSEILGALRQETNAPIVIYNLYNPFPAQSPLAPVTEQLETQMNAIIAKIASAAKNVVVVDDHAAFANHQMSYVRVQEGDIHPTQLGQSVLAQVGEAALAHVHGAGPANVTPTLLGASGVAAAGGSFAVTLGASQLTFAAPAGTFGSAKGTEVALTSQPGNSLQGLAKGMEIEAETQVVLPATAKVQSAYTLTIANPAITRDAAVYTIADNRLTPVRTALVSTGKVVVQAKTAADFVVIAPKQPVVLGSTSPVTGIPAAGELAGAFALIALGGGLVVWSRRRQREA